MSAPRKQQQVSLRGASAKEITRDALLEKVLHERELRSYARRASAAALFIQRIWRRYYVMKKVAKHLQEEWEPLANQHNSDMSCGWISNNLLRPFLFFATQPSTLHQTLQITNVKCMSTCFRILLQSINSADTGKNFFDLAVGTIEERSTWLYQARKLVLLCSFILADCDHTCHGSEAIVTLTALAMRLVVSLTNPKGWKSCRNGKSVDADIAAKRLIEFMITRESGVYSCIRRYFMKLSVHVVSQKKAIATAEDDFLITASAVTLALRPFHSVALGTNDDSFDAKHASEQYCIFILTVPYFIQCLPTLLLPALKHESAMLPCLKVILISNNTIFNEILKLEQSEISACATVVPSSGWALANIIHLATECNNDSSDCGRFVQGLDCRLYVHVMNCISENFLSRLENGEKLMTKDNDVYFGTDTSSQAANSEYCDKVKSSYINLLKPVHQQWHLRELLTMVKKNVPNQEADTYALSQSLGYPVHFKLLNIVYFYSYMLRIFSCLHPSVGSLPVLNLLSFTPGFLVELWETLEDSIFCVNDRMSHEVILCKDAYSRSYDEATLDKKQRRNIKDGGNKWVNVLQKIAGKSSDVGQGYTNSSDDPVSPHQVNEDAYDLWDIEAMRPGSQGISKDWLCMLHLFCATYAHLLLVLDDIEFYEKQVPFTLQQQQRITSGLNTFVYNSFIHNGGMPNKLVMDVAVRCLQLLYERDCRHSFCPLSLWVGPGRNGRIPIAAAARAHEAAAFTNLHSSGTLTIPSMRSILTTIPQIYPFEERVQMFREFVKMDKVSGRASGEVSGPGSRSIEIVVRRDHIVEDGYRQLNFLGSRLKSCINVSFISECGLPEAGLDYGGLSKEFLTDLSKAAFDPKYGIFSQTATSESNLIPNMSARLLENGIEMIEFLGRIVGKALYEGILLDYSFSQVFVQKLLGRYSFLDELSALDSELYRNLIYVKNFDGDMEELSLDFTVNEELCGKRSVIELIPGGKNVSVTKENKLQYVHAIADYKLNRQMLPLANAFYRGLIDLISPSWLSLFNANEFNQLLSGGKHDFDVDDLRSNTRYTGGYSEGSRTVKLFWEVIKGFRPIERCMLLKFVTSCSRAPLLGFKHLQPAFTIHKVACDVPLWAAIGGQDVDRLPSASTCYNTLKLPTYRRPSTLRNKLLYAISSNTGFELS